MAAAATCREWVTPTGSTILAEDQAHAVDRLLVRGDVFRLPSRPGQEYVFHYRRLNVDRDVEEWVAFGGDKNPDARRQFHGFAADEVADARYVRSAADQAGSKGQKK